MVWMKRASASSSAAMQCSYRADAFLIQCTQCKWCSTGMYRGAFCDLPCSPSDVPPCLPSDAPPLLLRVRNISCYRFPLLGMTAWHIVPQPGAWKNEEKTGGGERAWRRETRGHYTYIFAANQSQRGLQPYYPPCATPRPAPTCGDWELGQGHGGAHCLPDRHSMKTCHRADSFVWCMAVK